MLAEDGLELASRLRERGFAGIIILHTAESAHRLDEIRKGNPAIDSFIEKGNARRFKQQFAQTVAARSKARSGL